MTTHFRYPPADYRGELIRIVNALVVPGKGILAADETASAVTKSFRTFSDIIKNTEETRRQYRQLLFTADPTLSDYISGVIMVHETFYQKTDRGVPFSQFLKSNGISPGIKVDKGLVKIWGSEEEYTTQGLDDLSIRCRHYKRDGCDFTKWRCIFKIGTNTPSLQAITLNANILARFAAISQSFGLVPILQAEVLRDGDHDLERCQQVTETVLAACVKALNDHHVYLEGIILTPNMVTAGESREKLDSSYDVAEATVNTMRRTVPPAVPGINFISGGHSEDQATNYLNEINNVRQIKPWALSFSFGRALQASVLHAWGGRYERIGTAQTEFLNRAKANSYAALGKYKPGTLLTYSDDMDLFIANHQY